jgi:phage tail sheath protein FI
VGRRDTVTGQLTPGIVRQDVFAPPARSLLTGVPAFLGRASAPDDTPKPLAITLWPQFEAAFGNSASGYLADAVRGFFDNDGLLCYVVWLDGTGGLADALSLLDDVDEVDLICAPDLMTEAPWPSDADLTSVTDPQRMLLEHCLKRGDRFAILDAVPTTDLRVLTGPTGQRTDLTVASGAFGALYYPWLWVPGGDGNPKHVPPCGHVAGIYSRGDRRVGVHKVPANEVVEGVLDLQVNLTEQEVGTLYEPGVNCLRALPGRGIRVWGARTLSSDPLWRDVNARRLIGTIGRWIERFMAGLAFEPNDIRLWVRIMRELTGYLDGLFQRGALRGRSAEQAFFVKCDNETNTPEVVDAGLVVTQIGVAPTVPAEFIVVRVIHGASGVTVEAA